MNNAHKVLLGSLHKRIKGRSAILLDHSLQIIQCEALLGAIAALQAWIDEQEAEPTAYEVVTWLLVHTQAFAKNLPQDGSS